MSTPQIFPQSNRHEHQRRVFLATKMQEYMQMYPNQTEAEHYAMALNAWQKRSLVGKPRV